MRFISSFRFRFRLIPFVAALIMVCIGFGLGQWQIQRADQKRAIAVKLTQRALAPALEPEAVAGDLAELEYRRLRLRGEFLPAWPLYLDNRPQQGRAGFFVLMPFRLANSGKTVMVERGWVARDGRDRAHLPPLATPPGTIIIEGKLRSTPGRVMQLGEVPPPLPGAILQNFDAAGFARASGLVLQPYLLEQSSAVADGLTRDWSLPSAGIDRHLGYAFQWFALAAMACIFFVVTGLKRGKPETE